MPQLAGPSVAPRNGEPAQALVVLLHGVGADGHDLIGLAPELAPYLPPTLFVAPDAPFPCDMAAFGRQWFSLQDRRPWAMLPGLSVAGSMLNSFLDELLIRHRLDERRLALVGFSQGAMLALHAAPRRGRPVAGVLGYSGALVGGPELAREVRSRPSVMLIHGDVDDVVPFEAMFLATEALAAAEIPVQWLRRSGLGHAIDPYGLEQGGRFLAAMLKGARSG